MRQARGCLPIGVDLLPRPLECFFFFSFQEFWRRWPYLVWAHGRVVEAIRLILVQSNEHRCPGQVWSWRRKRYLGLSHKLKLACCFLQMQKKSAWGSKVREALSCSQRRDSRNNLNLDGCIWNFQACLGPAVWEVKRTKRAPSRSVRKEAILRDG